MKKQIFFLTKVKQLLFLSLSIAANNVVISQQEQADNIYFLKKDWTNADNIREAVYFLQILPENDSTYICRYYNNQGAMVRQQSYLDSTLTIPNGRFCWYNKNGMLDSTGLVYRMRKTGNWIYYDDTKPVFFIRYNNGRFIERQSFSNNKDVDKTGENVFNVDNPTTNPQFKKAVFEDTAANRQWKEYLQKTISVPERFINISINGSGQVIVSFALDSGGKSTDIYLEQSCEWSADNEVFKAVKNGPPWKVADKQEDDVDNRLRDTVIFYANIMKPYDSAKKDVFVGTRIEAKFPGGTQAWARFLAKNLNAQVPADHNAPPGKYLVTVSFLIQKDGTVEEVKAINDPGYGAAEEAVRALKRSPKWIPAMQNGVPVKYRMKEDLLFQVSNY